MPSLDSVKVHGRRVLVQSMRACVRRDRLPWPFKATYVNGCQRLLAALDIESDETPLECDYETRFVAGPGGPWLNSILRYRGVWEPALSDFIVQHVQAGDVCVDAGANCGYFTVLLAQRVGPSGKVIAIEAAPENVRWMRANLDINGVQDTVEVVTAACARQKGQLTLHVHPQNDAWSRLRPPDEGQLDRRFMGDKWIPVTVPADTLGSIVGPETDRVSFIKLHIEGAEAEVAPDIPDTFHHPRLVVALLVKEPHIEVTLKPFRERGFHVYDRRNDYRWFYERKVPSITEVTYEELNNQHTAYVLLSRQPLVLPEGKNDSST
ncbi:MAG: FkbM family methyltransferase [Mycobacteriaceae bacterium]|nr:FkbM family methyltransferase [Mycobacteriaceae bacterium]